MVIYVKTFLRVTNFRVRWLAGLPLVDALSASSDTCTREGIVAHCRWQAAHPGRDLL